jgi:hypothetical protein
MMSFRISSCIQLLLITLTLGGCSPSEQSPQSDLSNDETPDLVLTPIVNPPTSPSVEQTGYLLDSAVAGVRFRRSDGNSGLTADDGAFAYFQGDRIDFSIGDIDLGFFQTAATASGNPVFVLGGLAVTPVDMVGNALSSDDARVINRLILLQSLDEDGNPANGIVINEATRLAANNRSIDFDLPVQDFIGGDFASFVDELNTLAVFTQNSPRSVRGEIEALRHFGNLKKPGIISFPDATTFYRGWWSGKGNCTDIGSSSLSIYNASVTLCPNVSGYDGCFDGVIRADGRMQFPNMPRNGQCEFAGTYLSTNGELIFTPEPDCVAADRGLLTQNLRFIDGVISGDFQASCSTANQGAVQNLIADFSEVEIDNGDISDNSATWALRTTTREAIDAIIQNRSCASDNECQTLVLSGTTFCSLEIPLAYAPANVDADELRLHKQIYSDLIDDIARSSPGGSSFTICSNLPTPGSICVENQCELER